MIVEVLVRVGRNFRSVSIGGNLLRTNIGGAHSNQASHDELPPDDSANEDGGICDIDDDLQALRLGW